MNKKRNWKAVLSHGLRRKKNNMKMLTKNYNQYLCIHTFAIDTNKLVKLRHSASMIKSLNAKKTPIIQYFWFSCLQSSWLAKYFKWLCFLQSPSLSTWQLFHFLGKFMILGAMRIRYLYVYLFIISSSDWCHISLGVWFIISS